MTTLSLDEKLRDAAVVLEATDRGQTGAQAIAPDHAGRPAYRADEMPSRGTLPVTAETAVLQYRVQQFLQFQSELLDRKQWRAYIDLFTDDGVYWMPASADQTSWLDAPSIFAEDKPLMEVRMGRITHPNAWSQAPVWMTSHIVGNAIVDERRSSEVVVRSRFHVVELRRDTMRHFAGSYRHVLAEEGGDFRIRLQRVDLINGHAPFDYVIQAWL